MINRLGSFGIRYRGHYWLWCPLFFLLVAGGCVNKTVPRKEYNLARTAYEAAKDSEASRYAPNLYHKAERYFNRAEELFEERRFDKAVEFFKKARAYSERSENVARLKQFKQGEMTP